MFRAVAKALENMAFMEVEHAGSPPPTASKEPMGASLLIHDPVQWELTLSMPRRLVLDIVTAVYAMPEDEVAEELLHDLLAELLNTIAGRFLSEILRPSETFTLGLPERCRDAMGDERPLLTWHYIADGLPFGIAATGPSLAGLNGRLKVRLKP